MAKEVFANSREVSSKKSGCDAVTIPSDVCGSPPQPPKVGVPIPYPNLAKCSTLAKGSKTVKIKGQPVSLKNKSYYKKSNGNQPATQAFKKGIISGKITGKTYATSWSGDVKIEKKNAVRFMDSTSHNG